MKKLFSFLLIAISLIVNAQNPTGFMNMNPIKMSFQDSIAFYKYKGAYSAGKFLTLDTSGKIITAIPNGISGIDTTFWKLDSLTGNYVVTNSQQTKPIYIVNVAGNSIVSASTEISVNDSSGGIGKAMYSRGDSIDFLFGSWEGGPLQVKFYDLPEDTIHSRIATLSATGKIGYMPFTNPTLESVLSIGNLVYDNNFTLFSIDTVYKTEYNSSEISVSNIPSGDNVTINNYKIKFESGGYKTNIYPAPSLSAGVDIYLPMKSGTFATLADIQDSIAANAGAGVGDSWWDTTTIPGYLSNKSDGSYLNAGVINIGIVGASQYGLALLPTSDSSMAADLLFGGANAKYQFNPILPNSSPSGAGGNLIMQLDSNGYMFAAPISSGGSCTCTKRLVIVYDSLRLRTLSSVPDTPLHLIGKYANITSVAMQAEYDGEAYDASGDFFAISDINLFRIGGSDYLTLLNTGGQGFMGIQGSGGFSWDAPNGIVIHSSADATAGRSTLTVVIYYTEEDFSH